MFSKTLVVAAFVAGALAAPSRYVFLHRDFFLFSVNAYLIALVNAALPINCAATASKVLTTRKLLRLLRASVSPSTLIFLLVSPAPLSPSLRLLATSGKWH